MVILDRIYHAFSILLLTFCVLLPYHSVVAAQEQVHQLQIDFTFATQPITGKQVIGYRLYKEGIPACDSSSPVDSQSFTCTIHSEPGIFNFTISALFDNQSESPESPPFSFTVQESLEPLSAVINLSALQGSSPLAITLDASESSGPINNFHWSFGDGSSADGAIVQHIYQTLGNYTATLTISDASGDSSQTNKMITVDAPSSPNNEAPTAVISSSNAIGEVPFAVQFSGSDSSAINPPILSYIWDFGDGNSGQGANITHTLTTPGTYKTTLTVTDSAGLSHSTSTPVIISAATGTENHKPIAVISTSHISGKAPFSASLSAAKSIDSDGFIANYLWQFGDGTSGSGVSVQHTFTQPANYTVNLTVTDNLGISSSTTAVISVVSEEDKRGTDILPILYLLLLNTPSDQ